MAPFKDRAKQMLAAAREEAARYADRHAKPEHLLMVMARGEHTVSTRVLERMGVPRERLLNALGRQMPQHPEPIDSKLVVFDHRLERVLSFAGDEARQANLNYTGTEHLLLGILREGDGMAYSTLAKLGIDIVSFRREVNTYLGGRIEHPRKSKSRLTYEIGKFADPTKATPWMNGMIARGFKLTYSSTSNGELWLIVEGLIPIPEAPTEDEAAGDSGAAKTPEKPGGEEGRVDSR